MFIPNNSKNIVYRNFGTKNWIFSVRIPEGKGYLHQNFGTNSRIFSVLRKNIVKFKKIKHEDDDKGQTTTSIHFISDLASKLFQFLLYFTIIPL